MAEQSNELEYAAAVSGQDRTMPTRALPAEHSPVGAGEGELKRLMLHALGGDARAERRLFEGCADRLRRYHFRRLPMMDAEDLVQETLIALHLHGEHYNVERSFTNWIDGIATHKMLDHLRRLYRRPTVPLSCARSRTVVSPDPSVVIDVQNLLRSLPPGQSEAVRLVKLQGCSAAETAQRTGQSVSNIKVRVHRGIRRMRRDVEVKAITGSFKPTESAPNHKKMEKESKAPE